MLKLHDKCPSPKVNCQKINTFTPNQYMLEGGQLGVKCKRRTNKAWHSFIEAALKMATPLLSAAVAAKTKSPQSAQLTIKILKP